MISDGSVGTFCSKITLPASSTTHTDVSFTDTSKPTKCAISSLLPRCSRSPDLDPFIATEGDARSASKAEPQPPRYTIFVIVTSVPLVDMDAASLDAGLLLQFGDDRSQRMAVNWYAMQPLGSAH